MTLVALQVQDWSGSFSYAPPLRDAAVNLNEVVSAVEYESRGAGPWMRVTLRDGSHLIARGSPSSLVLSEATLSETIEAHE